MTMDHSHMTTHSKDITDLEEGDTLQHTCGGRVRERGGRGGEENHHVDEYGVTAK